MLLLLFQLSGKSYYSTDPKDLPDGFTVGSMSVAYVPLQQRAEVGIVMTQSQVIFLFC